MSVGVQCHVYARAAQSLLNNFGVDVLASQQGCASMTQVIETDLGYAGFLDHR